MASHAPTDIEAEFYIDGSYVSTYSGNDLTHRVRGGNNEGSIRISRGVADYQAGISPQTAQFTLNNADGLFTDDNPNSPLFEKFGQNTRARLGVKSGGTWGEYLRLPDYVGQPDTVQYAYTVDKASLDITSDIDIRVEFSPLYTRGRQSLLAGKWLAAGNQRSWLLFTQPDGGFKLWTSPDGTLTNALSNTTIPVVDENVSRMAVRVTLDVNDGAGNRVYTYYTAETIAGPWTSFATGTIAGTTSLFSSTADLEIGTSGSGSQVFVGANTFSGKIHALELYSGIAGTLVADFKPDGKGLETTTWADSCASPNTWLLTGSEVRLASDRVRVAGEITATPIDWDKTGNDVWCSMSLAGLLARYSTNKAPLRGCVYRYYRLKTDLTDYWPCEDSDGATSAASAVTNGKAGQIFGCTFGPAVGIDGATGMLTLDTANSSFARFGVGVQPSATGVTTQVFFFRLAALPSGSTTFATTFIGNGGTAKKLYFAISSTSYTFTFVDATNATVSSASVGFGATPLNQTIGMSVRMTQEGGNVRWETAWFVVGTATFYTHTGGGTTFAGTCGQFARINFSVPDANLAGAQICHVVLTHGADLINTLAVSDVSAAFNGETFGARAKRLTGEEGIFFQWRGDLDDTLPVGPQPADTLYNILAQGQQVAGGILTDARDIIGLEYVTQRFLGNRRGLELSYSSNQIVDVPMPVSDLRYLVNDFTASRVNGSSARYEANDGRRKNVNDPPTGVGRWELSGSFNAYTDTQLPLLASQKVFFGTWEERRIPNLGIALHRSQINGSVTLLRDVIALDLGDPVTLTGLSTSPLPPNDLAMLTFGYTEQISNKLWSLTENTVPAGPFQVPILGDYSDREPRMDVDDSTHTVLKSALTSSATSFVIKTDASSSRSVKVWVDSTNFPDEIGGGETIDVNIGGERITLSNIGTPTLTGGFNEQTCTVSARSVNGITKAHSAGDSVELWDKYYLGME